MTELFTSKSQEAEFYKALDALYQDQQRVHAEITRVQAWSLLSAIQFITTHPLATDSDSIKRAIRTIQRLEPTIVGNSEMLQELASAGWERRVPRIPVESSLTALEQGEDDDITLELHKSEAYCLIAAIQLAQRHQEYGMSAPSRVSRRIAEELQNAIAPDGILAEVLQAGWDESFDAKYNVKTKEVIKPPKKLVEVYNVWAVYGLNDDGTEAEDPIAQPSRPQDWGDAKRWHYEKFTFEWDTEEVRYVNHAHCWTDLKRPKSEYARLFAPLIVEILMPGTPPELCGRDYLEVDDFWQEGWGPCPAYFEQEVDEYFLDTSS